MNNGIILDMDGTLIDSHQTHVDCWIRYAERDGIVLDPGRVNRVFGQINREIIRSIWPCEITDEKVLEIGDGKEALVRDSYRKNFPPLPGATELVRRLHDHGFKLAVGSSGPKENVDLACELLGITPLLGAIVSSSDVSRGKPHPEIFLTAAKRIGVSPEQCVVIEDATVGIDAAHAAGMKCIAILSTGHGEDELKDAEILVHSLEEITPEMIVRLLE